jgi:hypothetical protein
MVWFPRKWIRTLKWMSQQITAHDVKLQVGFNAHWIGPVVLYASQQCTANIVVDPSVYTIVE